MEIILPSVRAEELKHDDENLNRMGKCWNSIRTTRTVGFGVILRIFMVIALLLANIYTLIKAA